MIVDTNDNLNVEKSISGGKIVQYVAAITANLGIVCCEMHYGWTSPSLPILISGNYSIQITSEQASWLPVTPLFGAILGSFITGLIVDYFGRKQIILFSAFPFLLSWLIIGWANSYIYLHVARFIDGVLDGMSFTAVPMYLGEIAEPKIRGMLASICPVLVVFGILLINVLGSFMTIDRAAYTASVVPVILFFTFFWMPESPYYLIMKGRVKEARKNLQILRGDQDVSAELERISNAVKEQNSKDSGKYIDLFTVKSNRKALIIAWGLRTSQHLSGAVALNFYCTTIFQESSDFITPEYASIIFFSIQLLLSAVSSFIVDFSGRRPLLIFSIIGTGLSLVVNGTYLHLKNSTDVDTSSFNFLQVLSLCGYVVVYSVGLQTIPMLMMGELFPTNVKGFALGMTDIYISVLAAIVSKFFHWTNESYGMEVPFYTFAGCCIFGLLFVIFFVPETKGKTLEDIQKELKGETVEEPKT